MRLERRAPELFASLNSQINTALQFGTPPHAFAPTPIAIGVGDDGGLRQAPQLFRIVLNIDSTDDSLARTRRGGPAVAPRGLHEVEYVALTETGLADAAFVKLIAKRLARVYFDLARALILRLPNAADPTATVETRMRGVFDALAAAQASVPVAPAPTAFFATSDLPPMRSPRLARRPISSLTLRSNSGAIRRSFIGVPRLPGVCAPPGAASERIRGARRSACRPAAGNPVAGPRRPTRNEVKSPAMPPLRRKPPLTLDVGPLFEAQWTGIPVFTRRLVQALVMNGELELTFAHNLTRIADTRVFEAIRAGSGVYLADEFASGGEKEPEAADADAPVLYPSNKGRCSGLVAREASTVHDMTTLFMPDTHDEGNIAHHLDHLEAELRTDEAIFCISEATRASLIAAAPSIAERIRLIPQYVDWPESFELTERNLPTPRPRPMRW